MFDKVVYVEEMKKMVDKAIKRVQNGKPGLVIYTVSIITDPSAAISSISIDDKKNSIANVKKANSWSRKYYKQYIAEGDLEQAELFKPVTGTRMCNPADFLLRDFVHIKNRSFPVNWEESTGGKCWKSLNPVLKKTGDYAFDRFKILHLDKDFELAVNSKDDWYDKTWK